MGNTQKSAAALATDGPAGFAQQFSVRLAFPQMADVRNGRRASARERKEL